MLDPQDDNQDHNHPTSIEELQEKINQLETDKKQMIQQHDQQMKQLEKELNNLKSRFITTVSHEFRTPLTTISFSAGLLENYSNKISEEKKQTHFQRIKQGIEQMTSLLEDTLIIGKLDSGSLEINFTSVNLEKICRVLVEKMQQKTNQHEIIFSVQGTSYDGKFDEMLLKQLINHLLSNAIKYAPEGGEIKFELICENQQALFKIQDQGIGIPKSNLDRLFTNYYRGTNIGNISGTGLGLSLVKQIVDLHDGKITIESEENQGTKIIVILPLNADQQS
ncbi:his Kinase A domain protein [Lyngbya aestuarii BL J]|uniref:histidine kinase n=1 Tax=Lyngbya aestuarii BL J TaxID=1348334 RepID=U7QLS6_9CYAN|nr:HAMP domain-containing sensor histidine kinase [Lyngbya aestuarii]ERT08889.1 his Kinase A domain protein [Lyngbya aestuarii BL J]